MRARDVIGLGLGVGLAVAGEQAMGSMSASRRRLGYAIGLPVAAAIYPLARRTGHLGRAGLVELGALAAYAGFVSQIPGQSGDRALAAGWASHAAFDALHHSGPDSRIPGWYPAACAGYDLAVAAALLRG